MLKLDLSSGSAKERTVGVFLWVFDKTISRKSAAVGTGAMAFMPLVELVDILSTSFLA